MPTFSTNGQTKNCTACMNRELYLNFTKEELRKEILRKLNLKAPPNVNVDMVPKHMIAQMRNKYRHDLEDSNVNIMSDDPNAGNYVEEEVDDFHFQTRLINVLAQDGK